LQGNRGTTRSGCSATVYATVAAVSSLSNSSVTLAIAGILAAVEKPPASAVAAFEAQVWPIAAEREKQKSALHRRVR